MARLLIKTTGLGGQSLELRQGVNRLGRSPENDFQIEHPSVSGRHCELVVSNRDVVVRDLDSTNGTFVNGQRIQEATLSDGETVHVGEVELVVHATEPVIAIPKFIDNDLPAPPVVTADGAMICPRHAGVTARFKCGHCKEVMCEACVHRMRRKGGNKTLLLCPTCSHTVDEIVAVIKPKKKSFFTRMTETVKLKLTGLIPTRKR